MQTALVLNIKVKVKFKDPDSIVFNNQIKQQIKPQIKPQNKPQIKSQIKPQNNEPIDLKYNIALLLHIYDINLLDYFINKFKELFSLYTNSFDKFHLYIRICNDDENQSIKNIDDIIQYTENILNLNFSSNLGKSEKNYNTADYIRDALQDIGIQIKDGKDDVTWTLV